MIVDNIEALIWLQLKSRIDLWVETTVLQPDALLTPSAKQSFIIVQDVGLEYSGAKPIDPECGEPIDGVLNASVMVPVNWTMAQHKGMAGRWCDHMRKGFPMFGVDFRLTLRDRPRIIGGTRLDGAWNRLETQVPYRAWG